MPAISGRMRRALSCWLVKSRARGIEMEANESKRAFPMCKGVFRGRFVSLARVRTIEVYICSISACMQYQYTGIVSIYMQYHTGTVFTLLTSHSFSYSLAKYMYALGFLRVLVHTSTDNRRHAPQHRVN